MDFEGMIRQIESDERIPQIMLNQDPIRRILRRLINRDNQTLNDLNKNYETFVLEIIRRFKELEGNDGVGFVKVNYADFQRGLRKYK